MTVRGIGTEKLGREVKDLSLHSSLIFECDHQVLAMEYLSTYNTDCHCQGKSFIFSLGQEGDMLQTSIDNAQVYSLCKT